MLNDHDRNDQMTLVLRPPLHSTLPLSEVEESLRFPGLSDLCKLCF
jgi:hypothetical protein